MNDEMVKSLVGLAGVPIVAALLAVIKPFVRDIRFHPLLALALGVVVNILGLMALRQGDNYLAAGLIGVVVGLAASGMLHTITTIKVYLWLRANGET